MDRDVLPTTVDALIDMLAALHPPLCIQPGESAEDAHRRAGSREVVDYLRHLQAKETDRELEAHKNF